MINTLKHSFSCARIEFLRWVTDPRIIIAISLGVFVYSFAVDPINANAELMDRPINYLEPYIAVLNSGLLLLVIPLGFLSLVSDFPNINGSTLFFILRTGKKSWLSGQIIKLIMMVLSYIFFIFVSSLIGISNGTFGLEWSDVVVQFRSKFPELSGNFGAQLLPENLYHQMTLLTAFIKSTLFVAVYLFMLGMILLAFTLAGKKTAGVVSCGAIISLGAALCSINTDLKWLFPMSHSIVWLHYTQFLREPIFPIALSGVYFAVIIAVLLFFCIIALKKFNYDNITETE